eukprot:6218366-Prymnesium_polylepis.1
MLPRVHAHITHPASATRRRSMRCRYGNILNPDYAFYLPPSLDPQIADICLKLLTADPLHRHARRANSLHPPPLVICPPRCYVPSTEARLALVIPLQPCLFSQDVKQHPFFVSANFDWDALYRGELTAEYQPPVSGNDDTSNFEVCVPRGPCDSLSHADHQGTPISGLHAP